MNISEFERQKQYRIDTTKRLVRESLTDYSLLKNGFIFGDEVNEKELSRLVKAILVEIDKV